MSPTPDRSFGSKGVKRRVRSSSRKHGSRPIYPFLGETIAAPLLPPPYEHGSHGEMGRGLAWSGLASLVRVRCGQFSSGPVRPGEAVTAGGVWQVPAGLDKSRRVRVRSGQVRSGQLRLGLARYGSRGLVWQGLVRQGAMRFGEQGSGMTRRDKVRQLRRGWVGLGSMSCGLVRRDRVCSGAARSDVAWHGS